MNKNEIRKKLINLGTEYLADTLLELSTYSEEADNLLTRIISTPEENLKNFKSKLSKLKRSKRFIYRSESAGLANELNSLLNDLSAAITDPVIGIKFLVSFYESDKHIFNNCDDSYGHVGEVFVIYAKDLFIQYASKCADKDKIANIILKLNKIDDYGVRFAVIDSVSEFLPEKNIRSMIENLKKKIDIEENDDDKNHYLSLIKSLAKQLKDTELFEETVMASYRKLSTPSLIDISKLYFEKQDFNTALSYLSKTPENDSFMRDKQDELLINIYRKLNDNQNLSKILYRKLSNNRTKENLNELLEVIGMNKYDEFIKDELEKIFNFKFFNRADVEFLISIGKIDDAERYIFEKETQINGDFYDSLLPLAKSFESEKCYLATTVIYRKLIISILERGYTKAYTYCAGYLKKLDKLSDSIIDWDKFDNHDEFKHFLHQTHGLKKSFWAKYESDK